MEDIAEDCSAGLRRFLEAALERNPNQRPSAKELLKHEALHPPREEQPRCQSLDSALFERKRLLTRKDLELPENITGKNLSFYLEAFYVSLLYKPLFATRLKIQALECLLFKYMFQSFGKMKPKKDHFQVCGRNLINCSAGVKA